MAVLKCKMCGGDLAFVEGASTAECEYCGSLQTIPKADDEKKLTLFARANRLRAACEFDKAAGIYEAIVADFPEEAEAYWGLVLCKYGIEYVDDPATGKKIPTCHRSSFDSIMADSDFEQVLENADVMARKIYREEAKTIEEIRKGIIAVSANEEPYDIFICYKETDEKGDRTLDSVLAQDVYDALTDKGYRVFFSRITLEEKLGVEYEPYIFAALNSAKIMLVFGTDYEYFNAVWVKNEWSRFLKLMAKDKEKHLIPCYKGIDAYDMPSEFAKLQAQDLGKVGAIQDLLRGIEKIIPRQNEAAKETVVVQQASPAAPGVDSLLERAFMFLEDSAWNDANTYCEKVLDIDPKNAQAYLGKLMAELHCKKQEDLQNVTVLLENNRSFQKAQQLGDNDLKAALNSYSKSNKILYAQACSKQKEKKKKIIAISIVAVACLSVVFALLWNLVLVPAKKYNNAVALVEQGKYIDAKVVFEALDDYKDAKAQSLALWDKIAVRETISAGHSHTVGLKSDGTVVAVGDNHIGQCDVSDWQDVIAISVGEWHTVGLKSDGTVVAVGLNDDGAPCDVNTWQDIVAISAGSYHTVGLKADGTVVAVGRNEDGQCDVSSWKDIVAISAGINHTVGLKSDGTVVAVGTNRDGLCDVSDWKDIVAISAGSYHTVGLKADGTVVAIGENGYGQCKVSTWQDIVAIGAGVTHTVGLKSDGTAVAVGFQHAGRCDVRGWTNIKVDK